jgi:hypothetical protein
MTERSPLPHPDEQLDSFEPEPISDALRSHPEPVEDIYGDGLRWHFGLGERTTLDVFPDTWIARIAFPDAQLLFRANPPHIEEGKVIFESLREHTRTRVMVTPSSWVTRAIATFGEKASESRSPALQESADSSIAEGQEKPLLGDSATSHEVSRTPDKPEKEKTRRFEGIVAATPWFKTRESDQKFIGGFPLGIGEQGKRHWVDVYVTADRARWLQEQVEQGVISKQSDIVVVGFPKEKSIEQQGETKTRRWINAVAIKPKASS